MEALPRIVVITGPTGSGKSALALRLAQQLDGELINADSVQVYKDFDIGSAKPGQQEMTMVPHHLFSALSPSEQFDAETFRQMANDAIDLVLRNKRVPIVVGGTGLYVRSLLCGLVPLEPISPESIREVELREETWRGEFEKEGSSGGELKSFVSQKLYGWLLSIDEKTAKTLHPSDANRIRRALTVKISSGESLHDLQERHAHSIIEYQPLVICISPERETLYQRIDTRVDAMFAAGFLEEVIELRKKYDSTCRAFSSLGYRHAVDFIEGRLTEGEMKTSMKRDTRRFAKRQLTWWRNQPEKLGWGIVDPRLFLAAGGDSSYFDIKTAMDDIQALSDKLTVGIGRFLDEKETAQSGLVEFLCISDMDVAPKRCNSL